MLHVKRDVGGKGRSAVEAPVAPPVPSRPMSDEIITTPTLTAAPTSKKVEHDDGEDIDEGLLYVTSPKVKTAKLAADFTPFLELIRCRIMCISSLR